MKHFLHLNTFCIYIFMQLQEHILSEEITDKVAGKGVLLWPSKYWQMLIQKIAYFLTHVAETKSLHLHVPNYRVWFFSFSSGFSHVLNVKWNITGIFEIFLFQMLLLNKHNTRALLRLSCSHSQPWLKYFKGCPNEAKSLKCGSSGDWVVRKKCWHEDDSSFSVLEGGTWNGGSKRSKSWQVRVENT